jgi:hypothetical protein
VQDCADSGVPAGWSPLKALALVCSLKPSPAPSSSQLLATQVLDALAAQDVSGELVRVVDHDVKPGVDKDMGTGTHGRRSGRGCSLRTCS